MGSVYGESPKNIKSLIRVLKSKSANSKIDKLLSFIEESERLNGVIVDPETNGKKSLRDLINHRERVDIFFSLRKDQDTGKYTLSKGALLNMKHPEIIKFHNYLVTEISTKIWILLLGIIENCFKIQFDDTAK